ncbi:chloride channel protein [soil metagenome]
MAAPTIPTVASQPDSPLRSLTNPRLFGFAVVIGIAGGLVATVYYYLLQLAMHGVWYRLAHITISSLPVEPSWKPVILLITTSGGLVVGLLTRWLGSAGEIAAVVDNIHLRDGRIDMRQTPSMTATSLASIAAGGSAGPEAPLVQIIGSVASTLGDRLRVDGRIVRTFTFCGMGAALGAFFGAPLGGALFALEIPHRRGIEYYEALLPAIIAAVAAFLVFRSIVGYEHILFHFTDDRPLLLAHVFYSILFGAIGAGVATLFAASFALIGKLAHRLHHAPVLLGTFGGLVIGLLAQLSPKSLFWGEFQIDTILQSPAALLQQHGLWIAVGLLLLLAVVKALAIGATLHSGFRGGFIFPLMFIGAVVGTAISLLVPSVPAPVIILSLMAAVNVAVTKTPISTCIILATLTGTSQMPVLITASLVSLLLTTKLNLIRTQRTRHPHHAPFQPAHA